MIQAPVLTDDERNAMEVIAECVTERRDRLKAKGKRCKLITQHSTLFLEGRATVVGADNVVFGFHCMIECRNTKVVGDRFVVKGSNNVIWGNFCKVTGSKHKIYGNDCEINASNCEVYGNNNRVVGNNNLVVGEGCIAEGEGNVTRLPNLNVDAYDSDDEDIAGFALHIQQVVDEEDNDARRKRQKTQREVSVIKPDPKNGVLSDEQIERLEAEEEEERKRNDAERAKNSDFKEEPKVYICKMCMERKVDTVITPCMHAQFCSHCVQACEDKTNPFFRQCPACRADYLAIVGMKIFT